MLTVNGQVDYGWADVTFNGFPPPPPTSFGPTVTTGAFTLNGFAYEDSGAAIPAGVPEPSTAALLVAGAAGAAVWRRRQQAARQQTPV